MFACGLCWLGNHLSLAPRLGGLEAALSSQSQRALSLELGGRGGLSEFGDSDSLFSSARVIQIRCNVHENDVLCNVLTLGSMINTNVTALWPVGIWELLTAATAKNLSHTTAADHWIRK